MNELYKNAKRGFSVELQVPEAAWKQEGVNVLNRRSHGPRRNCQNETFKGPVLETGGGGMGPPEHRDYGNP